jgi:hypothetical protein
MISNTPNLRFVKPLSKYMALRIRMYGRQRFAKNYTVTGANLNTVTLPFTPNSPHTLELYLDSVRVLSGYNVNGNVVSFTPPLAGKLECVDDDVFVDLNEKWLTVPLPNLLQSNDTANTAYGTDRREGQQVATKAHPVCITQGAIGFCRPSPDGEQLLYCPYYGMYGRDSITYAIKTDLGQLSDFLCIDIRVRDPNYIPTLRLACLSAVSNPVQVDGQLKDITPNGFYQIYADVLSGGVIQLPNKDSNEPKEYHFVIQGSDENGDWFEPEEYFDPGSFTINAETKQGFVVTYVGTAADYGFENATRISVMCDRAGDDLPISLSYMDSTLLSCTITSNKPIALETFEIVADNPLIELDDGGSETAEWVYNDDWLAPDGINLDTLWENPVFEERAVSATMSFDIQTNLYDPQTQLSVPPINYSKTVIGSFTTAEDPVDNKVVQPSDSQQTLLSGFYWENSNQFSNLYEGNFVLNSTFDWQIVVATP